VSLWNFIIGQMSSYFIEASRQKRRMEKLKKQGLYHPDEFRQVLHMLDRAKEECAAFPYRERELVASYARELFTVQLLQKGDEMEPEESNNS
jgi:hypothetical protein